MNLFDLNNNGVNDFKDITQWYGNTAYKVWGGFFDGVSNIFTPPLQAIGEGTGDLAGDLFGGVAKGLTSNIGGLILLGGLIYIISKKV